MKNIQTGKRENCINLIKLIAAIQVFTGHVIPSFNIQISKELSFAISVFEGVPIFFCISGFLIWGSIERSKYFREFAWKRIGRLYPELWGAVLINAIIMAILFSKNIHWPTFVLFQFTEGTIFQFWTPGFLSGYATGTPNGPLWTIGLMVQCYVALWFCYKFLHKSSVVKWVLLITASMALNVIRPLFSFLPHVVYRLIWNSFPIHLWMFLLGAFVWEYFDYLIGIFKKIWPLALIAAAIVTWFNFDIGNYPFIKSVSLLIFAVGFGYTFPKLSLKKDFSYGIYIYHMIVINVMVHFGVKGTILNILLAFSISLFLAVGSYFAVEGIRSVIRLHVNSKTST